MRSWMFFSLAVFTAIIVSLFHLTAKIEEETPRNPMAWASDNWTTWSAMTPGDLGSSWGGGEIPPSQWLRRFQTSAGLELWHAEKEWSEMPEGWEQRPWRGGWFCGTPSALDAWIESPGEMAKHWKEGEDGASLLRTTQGWALQSQGWVVWRDSTTSINLDDGEQPPSLFVPSGGRVPKEWWIGLRWEIPTSYTSIENNFRSVGIPLSAWGTRWSGGGRWHVNGGRNWAAEVRALADQNGWSVQWLEDDLVLNGGGDWGWTLAEELHIGQAESTRWLGTLIDDGAIVWVEMRSEESDSEVSREMEPTVAAVDMEGMELGMIRNHRTQSRMVVVQESSTIRAMQPDGSMVWSMALSSNMLPGGVSEVDVYANGKFQTMWGEESGLHLIDVKGREVSGFPISPSSGSWTAWAIVDYDGTRNYRYLLASSATGLIENYRREGESTPGWKHRPSEGIDVKSQVMHIRHLRIGSKDFIYVGRDNGQVELLKRNGATRALTAVKVNPRHAPLFRKGADLDRTSVIFIDSSGWVKEFTLGSGQEVGLSGMTRADRLEKVDVDADGLEEIVTWLRGKRTVWNTRNERVE